MRYFKKYIVRLFVIGSLLVQSQLKAQTPGMIFENKGIGVLDPNMDGFVSKTTTGFGVADKFANQQSEIPYVPFAVIQMEPTSDPGPGPNCFFNDFDDIREYGEPLYSYFDNQTAGGPNLLFRFRLSGYAPNSKSYSVFVDIDGRFGNPAIVGATAGDPNYNANNPGFEIEIYLATNFGVGIYNVDGVHSGTSSDPKNVEAKSGIYPYASYAQKSVAWNYPGALCTDGQQFFYDFYIPWSAVTALTFSGETQTAIGGPHVTTATRLRMVGATIMNPNPGFDGGVNNASLSDFGGIDENGSTEELVSKLINVFPPTTPEQIDDNQRIAPRSDCPKINTPIASATSVSGTSTEDNGTVITVYVSSASNFATYNTYTTTVSGGVWSANVPDGLVSGHYVKATAQNPNETYGSVVIPESVSYDDCDIEQVTLSCDDNKTPAVYNVTEINGRKGFKGSISNPSGHNIQISLYNINNTLVSMGAGATPNPLYTTGTSWEIQYGNTGNSFPPGIYYIVSRNVSTNICPSDYEYICMRDNNGDYSNISSTPTIPATFLSSATSISGTTNGETNSIVQVYINGIANQATVNATNWTLSPVSFSGCESIKVVQYRTSATPVCVSAAATATVNPRTAATPTITSTHCAGSQKTITGTSTEANGTLVDVYQGASLLGTAKVSNGKWALYGQTLTSGSVLTAKVRASTCVNASASSAGVTVGSRTANTGMSVNTSTLEGATSVTVKAPTAGGPYTLRLYIDYYHEAAWKSPLLTVAAGNNYTFNGLVDAGGNSLIYAGARLTVTAESAAGCESDFSGEFEVPCNASIIQSTKTVTAVSPVCSGNASEITIENSQKGIMYQVYNSLNNPIGYTAAGNGGNITISTGNLTYGGIAPALHPQSFTIKAIRMVPTTTQCVTSLNGGAPVVVNVKQDIGPVNLLLTASPSPTNICPGNTFTATVYSSQKNINYEMFNDLTNASLSPSVPGNDGNITITSNAISGTGNIPVRITASSGSCYADLSTIIAVQLKQLPVATAASNSPVCAGSSLNLTGGAPGQTYDWTGPNGFTSSAMSPVIANATTNMSGTYTLSVTGSNGCSTTASTNALVAINNPNITIADASVTEGNSGTANMNFTVSVSAASCNNITINYATSNGTATTANDDYTASSGSITINAGSSTGIISVPIVGDITVEGDQVFTVTLSSPSAGILTDAVATGSILEDDSAPLVTLSANNALISETDGVCTFTATLSSPSTADVTVEISISGSATEGDDYSLSSTSIIIPAGSLSGSITVNAIDDDIYESAINETVDLEIISVTNAIEDDDQLASTAIVENDSQPAISINDASVNEGGALSFTVSLSNASYETITVNYATSNGTATTADNDYTGAGSATLTFNQGETSKTVTVPTTSDTKYEVNETLTVTLSGETNATLLDGTGSGTITNEDSKPKISINDASVNEGGALSFTVTLNDASYETITVNYATSNGTASTADDDYTSGSGTLTFNPGEISKTVTVSTTADTKYEVSETLTVSLSGETNATLLDGTGSGTITNEDSKPTISINDASVNEGGALSFTVSLSNASYETITVNYATSDGTATTADNDYTEASSTTLTFNPGETSKTVTVSTTADTKYEVNETLTVSLSGETNATLLDAIGSGIITNEDSKPKISINDASVNEGDALSFTVILSDASYETITVNYATSDGTATTADNDYTAGSGTLTFNPGETTKTVTVSTTADTKYEVNETLTVSLSGETNATLLDGTGSGTITNEDSKPKISINDASVNEGGALSFTVTLSDASYETITVNYATSDGTATTADNDYTVGSGTLTFNPGETTKTVTVSTTADTKYEVNETLTVSLSGETNATLSDASGLGTITNEDELPSVTLSIANASIAENAGTTSVTATLNNRSYQDIDVTLSFGGTANGSGTDYSVSGNVISIPAGSLTGTITITVVQDVVAEGGESVEIAISSVTNATEDGEQQVSTLIADDDVADQSPAAVNDNASVNEDASIATNVSTNDTGLGDSGLVVTVTSGPAHGTVSISGTTVTYTPTANYKGSDSYTYQICDVDNDCSTATVDITVNSMDDIPAAVNDNASVDEDASVAINVSTNDTDLGDGGLVVTVTSGPAHGSVSISGTNVTYTPSANYNGADSYTYQICDGDNDCSSATVTISVTPVNDLPVAVNDNITVNEDASIATNVSTNDNGMGDGNLVVTVTGAPAHGSVSISGTTITYTPSANYNGTDSYTYQICDGDNDCSTATVTISVSPVNDLPVAVNDNITVNEDASIATNVSTNDTGLGDGGLVVTVTSGPAHGTVSISGTTVNYTPSANYNGADSYTYQICDGDNDCSSATVTITVTPVNDLPVAVNDNITVNEDASIATNVSTNDNGMGDGNLVVTVTGAPAHGSVSISGTTITYTPSANYNGTDSYTYQICDGDNDCSTATVTISVSPVNDLPVAVNDNITVNEDASIATNVSTNDNGLGDGGLVVTVTSGPAHGTVSILGTTVTYTPSANYNGADIYTYQICDADNDCSTATVTISVSPVNDLPVAVNDNITVNEDASIATNVSTNDTGLGDGGLVVTVTSGPAHGTVSISGTTVTYTPSANYNGADSYTYQICDGDNDCSTATVNITVTPVNDSPVAVNENVSVDEDASVATNVSTNDTGLGDGGLVVTVTSGPAHGTVSISGTTVTYTPSANYNGADSYTYQICDADNDCSTATVNLSVNSVNDIPAAVNDNASVDEDASVATNVSTNDTGLGDGGLVVTVTSGPAHGSVSISGTNVTYTPSANYNGTDSYTYQICDADNDCSTATVSISVTPVNDLPVAVNDIIAVNEDASKATNVSTNDNGLGDGGLVVTITGAPTHGSVSVSGTSVTYTLAANYNGTDSYTYQICDADNNCSTATVNITVNSVDDLPAAVNDNVSVNEDASVATDVSSNDTNLGDGGLVVSVTGAPAHGSVSISGTTVTYTPAANYNGTDSYTYQICDADNDCSTATVGISVNLVNDLPVAVNDIISVNEDASIETNVSTNDNGLGDGGLVVTITGAPFHGSVSISGTTVTYTPAANYNGTDSYTYQICDADNDCSTATVNITVNSVDDLPTAVNDNISVNEDATIATDVATNDTNLGDGGLIVTITGAPTHGNVSISGTTVTYTPAANYNGTDSYTYQICDADNDCSTATVNITVNSVDDLPTAVNDNVSVNEDASVATDVSSNDTNLGDGGLVVTVTGAPTHGSVSISGTTVTYTPAANFNGTDSYTYQICDADNDCSTATVNITVNEEGAPIDNIPNAINDNANVYEDESIPTDVSTNDTGLGDGGLVVTVTSGPAHGSVSISGTTVTYTPSVNYNGANSYTYQICDADNDCSSATVSISVTPVNDLPVAINDNVTVSEDASIATNVSTNDNGLGDGGLVVTVTSGPAHGTVSISGTTVTYTPSANYNGADSYTYQICDADNDCSTATVNLSVNSVNDIPAAVNDNASVDEDASVATNVSTNDTGLGDGGLVVTVTSGPAHGCVSISGTTVTYTPSANYNGADSYTYRICDGDNDCSTATVNITVNSIDDIPAAVNDIASVNEDASIPTDVSNNDTGLGDGGLVVNVTSGPAHGSVSISGTTVTYTPSANYNGADSYTYQICDADNDCSTATVNITVNSMDDIPAAVNDIASVNEDASIPTNVCTNDTGMGDDNLVVTVTGAPAHGSVSISGTTITYTPSANYNGTDCYTYQICDGDNDCSTATVTISVTSVNNLPVAVNDNITVNEDASIATNVSTNDTGLGDGGLVITVTSSPAHGTVSISGTTVTYTPSTNYNGADSYTYQICDADGDCANAQVTVSVLSTNHPPVVSTTSVAVTTKTGTPVNVCFAVTDADNDIVTATPKVNHGIIISSGNNCFTYTPDGTYTGLDTLHVDFCDPETCVPKTVPITIVPIIEKPVAKYDTLFLQTTIDKEVSGCIEMITPATGLTASVLTVPDRGTLTIENQLCVKYQPVNGSGGTFNIPVVICNNAGLCDTVIVSIDVIPVKIPQGFSPNGDGINEFFEIEGLELFDKVSVQIFNRWGNIVYKDEIYKNDWDGTSSNAFTLGTSKLPSGTYFYVVDFHNGKKSFTGYVYLSR